MKIQELKNSRFFYSSVQQLIGIQSSSRPGGDPPLGRPTGGCTFLKLQEYSVEFCFRRAGSHFSEEQ